MSLLTILGETQERKVYLLIIAIRKMLLLMK
mgnify:CR=1 FL=1